MAALAVTSRGQVTIRKEFLQHMGHQPGERIKVIKGPNGKLTLERAKPQGSWDDFIGCLAGRTKTPLSIEEMDEAIGAAIAAEYERGIKR